MSTTDSDPRLPDPFAEGPNASAAEQDAWEAAISAFVTHLALYKLSSTTTPAELFAPFDEPQHQPLLFYSACAHLLRATREFRDVGPHIALVASLFGLLKAEGLRRDDANGLSAFGNTFVFPTLRALASEIPTPPGYTYDNVKFALVAAPMSNSDAETLFPALAEYARAHAAQLRLWTLVGHLDAARLLGSPGIQVLLFHQAPVLLRALEDSAQRGVWETLWAAVLCCEGEDGEADWDWSVWGTGREEWLGPFKDAARTIALDERTPLEWRARFALLSEELPNDGK